jgi:hypothetical protein
VIEAAISLGSDIFLLVLLLVKYPEGFASKLFKTLV